jgi:putative transposase
MADWPHSPMHRFTGSGAYMVSCGTYLKVNHFHGTERLRNVCDYFLRLAADYQWDVQAWAVFPNHYHFVALASPQSKPLVSLIRKFHSDTALAANQWDGVKGRQVWYQYWETELTYERSYHARLSYVHRNAVHHGLVTEASLYPWCSAGWFQREATTSFYKTIMNFGIESLKVPDEFEVEWAPDQT